MEKKRVAILGSTGSIGTQALEVIDNFSERFDVELLTANNNVDLLIEQAVKFVPSHVVIANESKYGELKMALEAYPIQVHTGCDAIAQLMEIPTIDVALTALVGYSGLLPTINAIKSGKDIALANKETLVIAGDLIMKMVDRFGVNLYPVDSEHSAIFQCLEGEQESAVEKIILTASGGPFRGKSLEYLRKVTKYDALDHPNWCMGNKITIDSATLMNKGFEAIEAKWLFNLAPEQIDIVIHPQSIIHSMIQFIDGSIKAQLSVPDMKLPIQHVLTYPERLPSDLKRLNFSEYPALTFEKPDLEKFRNLAMAFYALEKGGNYPCVLNAANEIVVEAFLQEKIGFLEMSKIIEKSLMRMEYIEHPTYEQYKDTDQEIRLFTRSLL